MSVTGETLLYSPKTLIEGVCLMVLWFIAFDATFNNISVISWRSDLLVEETRIPGKTTDLSQVTEKLYHICCIENTSPREVCELTTLVALIAYVDDTLAIYSSIKYTIDMVQYDVYITLISITDP